MHLNNPQTNDQTRLTTGNVTNIGNNIYNQNLTNNTNVQIPQNTFNTNSNPTVTTISQQQTGMIAGELSRSVTHNIGAQSNISVVLNQSAIQPSPILSTQIATATASPISTSINNQQQMIALSINGTQKLIPMAAFTKLLQSKSNSNPSMTVSFEIFRKKRETKERENQHCQCFCFSKRQHHYRLPQHQLSIFKTVRCRLESNT